MMNYDEIKEYAQSIGYLFTDEDCAELIAGSYEGESVKDAVDDFISAYES